MSLGSALQRGEEIIPFSMGMGSRAPTDQSWSHQTCRAGWQPTEHTHTHTPGGSHGTALPVLTQLCWLCPTTVRRAPAGAGRREHGIHPTLTPGSAQLIPAHGNVPHTCWALSRCWRRRALMLTQILVLSAVLEKPLHFSKSVFL